MVDQYWSNLKKYKAFMMDCGLQDGLQGSNKEMDDELTRLGVSHPYETYEGDHTNHVKERWEREWSRSSRRTCRLRRRRRNKRKPAVGFSR